MAFGRGFQGFRDCLGNIMFYFSKTVDVDFVIHAEIFAIRDGLLTLAASQWSNSFSFIIESDFANAMAWFQDSARAP